MAEKPGFHIREENRGRHASDYWPLAVLIVIAALAAYATGAGVNATHRGTMHYFMGFFLCSFSMLKLFHPHAFADGFKMYDLGAKRFPAYAYVYPFVELLLGLCYLSFVVPVLTYIMTIAVFVFGAVGVVQALREGLDINCPCMGSILNVPLSTVTLTEDLAMSVMALMMLVSYAV